MEDRVKCEVCQYNCDAPDLEIYDWNGKGVPVCIECKGMIDKATAGIRA